MQKGQSVLSSAFGKNRDFLFTGVSPELNPDEYLNCDLKAGIHSKRPARNQKQLKAKVLSQDARIPKDKQRDFRNWVDKNKKKEGRGGADNYTWDELKGLAYEYKDS